MRVIFQLAICVCLIILVAGTISYIHEGPTFGGSFLLICVWGCLIPLAEITKKQFLNFGSSKKQELDDSSAERITQLERRLTDIQDIVITIDEKLGRVEKQSTESQPKEETE